MILEDPTNARTSPKQKTNGGLATPPKIAESLTLDISVDLFITYPIHFEFHFASYTIILHLKTPLQMLDLD
jgi:hypothetical protein